MIIWFVPPEALEKVIPAVLPERLRVSLSVWDKVSLEKVGELVVVKCCPVLYSSCVLVIEPSVTDMLIFLVALVAVMAV